MWTGWTRPFVVDDLTMPPLSDIVSRLWEPLAEGQPPLDPRPPRQGAFTAREAAFGFVLGAVVGFAIGAVLHHSRLLRRGFLPYVVASQTIPILAIAPMVVIWGGSVGLPVWARVGIISAFLTFFPVTINTIKGLDSADPRALELMRTYAASPWTRALEGQVPRLAAVHLRGVEDRGDRERRRRDHRRASLLDPGRARWGDPQLQPVLLARPGRALGDEHRRRRCSESRSSASSSWPERLVVRTAPEHVA